jgi:hypothetical protein
MASNKYRWQPNQTNADVATEEPEGSVVLFFRIILFSDISVDNPHCIRPVLRYELHSSHPLTNAEPQSYEQGECNLAAV